MLKIIGLGRFSSCMKWNSGVNFLIHCSCSSCIFLELVVIVTFPLSVLQMHFTIRSSCWYKAHNLFAYFTTGTLFCKSKLAGSGILIPYGIFGGIGCLSPTTVLALITYIIFLWTIVIQGHCLMQMIWHKILLMAHCLTYLRTVCSALPAIHLWYSLGLQ